MYTEKLRGTFDSGAAYSLAAATEKHFTSLRPFNVRRLALGETAISSTTAVVVTVYKWVVLGSNAGAVTLGTLTIPTTAPAGTVYYKDLSTVQKILPGEELVFIVTAVATTSGNAIPMFDADDSPETAANETHLVASA